MKDSLPCNKRWQGDKLVFSAEIDYFVFLSSSYESNTDALKHSNDTLEKTYQVGLVEYFFPFTPLTGSKDKPLCALSALGKDTLNTPKIPAWELFRQPKY